MKGLLGFLAGVVVVAIFPATALAAAGDFFQPATSPEPGGDVGNSIVSEDFNGDTHADLAVANTESNDITILLGDGTGNFVPAVNSPETGAGLWSIVAADVDNDDDVDLAGVNGADSPDGQVKIFLNNGSADFAAPLTEATVGHRPRTIVAAHLNGDTDVDLVAGNLSPATVNVLLNDGEDDGDFTATAASPIDVGGAATNITGLVATTIDNDGDSDIVVAKAFTDKIQVLSNNGSGIFAPLTEQTVGDGPGVMAAGNFNGGVGVDLAVGNGSDVSILNGVGDGTFTAMAGSPVSVGTIPSDSTTNAIVTAELSGDAHLDLAVAVGFNTAASRVVIFLGNGAGGFTPAPTSPELPTSATLGPNIPVSITADQFNGGNLDLAVSNIFPQPTSPVNILLNDATAAPPGGGGGSTTPPPKKCKKGQKLKKGKCVKKKKKKKKKK